MHTSTFLESRIAKPVMQRSWSSSLLRISFLNFGILAIMGLWLRGYTFIPGVIPYKFLLHAHSHFAFSGWVTPILLWLVLRYFSSATAEIKRSRLRILMLALIVSCYGMLLSFPFQGYGAISIFFSTLSIVAGFYLSILLWKTTNKEKARLSVRFLRAGLIYLCVSSIGPFATGPLIAMGKSGSPLYFDAIYFFLHFQYNGWFSFALYALFVRLLEQNGCMSNSRKAFNLLHLSCAPLFLLSTLWTEHPIILNIIGGGAAAAQLIGIFFLVADLWNMPLPGLTKTLTRFACLALLIKVILQLASALPIVAELASHTRDFVIAYLHLVLLGFISCGCFALLLLKEKTMLTKLMTKAIYMFLGAFVTTEILVIIKGIPSLQMPMQISGLLFGFSTLFPLSIGLMNAIVWKRAAPLQMELYNRSNKKAG